MTTLHDRLTALADDVPITPAEPDLWQRGRRLHRRRRAGTAAIVAACCLLLIALGFVDWQRRAPVEPASSDAAIGIPSEFHEPSKWLPGTEGKPWDPLAAVIPADRGEWFGTPPGLVGVSAATGDYRFLDLPHAISDGVEEAPELAVSPDGRYIAYWFAAPSTLVSNDSWNRLSTAADGYVVYDVVRAEVVLHEEIQADIGVFGDSIAWADDDTVAFSFSEILQINEDGSSSKALPVRVHDVPSGSFHELGRRSIAGGGGGWLALGQKRLRSADAEHSIRLAGRHHDSTLVSPDGTRVASLRHEGGEDGSWVDGRPNHIVVADLDPADSGAELSRIPGESSFDAVLGWRDNNVIMATRAVEDTDLGSTFDGWTQLGGMGVFAVDVETGDEVRVTTVGPRTQLTTGLLQRPMLEHPAPPEPVGPWAKAQTIAVIVMLGGGLLLFWRRRVRP